MQTVTIEQIVDQLRKLPADKLKVVYEFVSYLLDRLTTGPKPESVSEPEQTTLVDKEGVLVVRAEPLNDLTNITRRNRDLRVFDLVQQTDLEFCSTPQCWLLRLSKHIRLMPRLCPGYSG